MNAIVKQTRCNRNTGSLTQFISFSLYYFFLNSILVFLSSSFFSFLFLFACIKNAKIHKHRTCQMVKSIRCWNDVKEVYQYLCVVFWVRNDSIFTKREEIMIVLTEVCVLIELKLVSIQNFIGKRWRLLF